ncbi:Retrovirus-related Pol polyprotein from transposon opus [Araneus ventricosus]|uniref:Retrovirus-related Pol polyprotein from transposon opus n=1 Tax=Araneus ventricosus TaxID=182803 RepID=A0A4Y2F1M5_ARAVE|nr:Retrovirus-related Pol polyprotein from transposon opus [Araneus ventricosus]
MAGQEGLQLDTTPVTLYMEKLKKQLEDTAKKAKLISTIQQEKMAHHYNLRSTKKIFNPGDNVIVLIPDSKNKLLARWQGPCTIESRRNEHSFVVKMPDASVRHVHQNKMREFVASSGSVNVIFEGEEEFGDVESTPLIEDSFCQEIKSITSSDLSATQRNELETMLKEFEPLFNRPVAIGEHVIELLPNVTRQKPHSYSVPMSYRREVYRQVKELLDLDLIEPSNADVTYPIVCVAKKDASIRMCIDYRVLNAVTKVPNYPMKDIQELIFTAGMAQWLSCLDLLKGYYQIKMHDENRVLTAFSTHISGRLCLLVYQEPRGKREEESFCRLKKALCEATALNAPDFGKPLEIHADASDYAVGCCLAQKDEKGNYRPIAFVSQKFNKTQRNWATIEKEAYAILLGFKKFDKWLHGTTVEIVTDHNPLKYLIEKTPKSPKLTGWALALQRWSYKITHRPGILNQDADALSRLQTK